MIPHERATSYTTPGYSNSSCYGTGNGWGYITSVNVNCHTVSTPPHEYHGTRRTMEVYNLVEASGMGYTIRCTATWVGSACSGLIPGDTFSAEVKDTTMWITGRRGGNMGKEARAKFRIMDIRPLAAFAPVQTTSPVPGLAPNPVPPPQLATPALPPTSVDAGLAARATSVLATQPAPVPTIYKPTPLPEVEARPEITVTSDPNGALVEVNGRLVGTTPITVAVANGTSLALTVHKDGFAPWIAQSIVPQGKLTINASLVRLPDTTPAAGVPAAGQSTPGSSPSQRTPAADTAPGSNSEMSSPHASTHRKAAAGLVVDDATKLMVFGGEGHKAFLGCLSCSNSDPDSVSNSYGTHGSRYAPDSIFNSWGLYGSRDSKYSPCNPNATDPPVISNPEGEFYGRLSVNRHYPQPGNPDIVRWLRQTVCRE